MRKTNIAKRFPLLDITQDELSAYVEAVVEGMLAEHPDVAKKLRAIVTWGTVEASMEIVDIFQSCSYLPDRPNSNNKVGFKILMQVGFKLLSFLSNLELIKKIMSQGLENDDSVDPEIIALCEREWFKSISKEKSAVDRFFRKIFVDFVFGLGGCWI